MYVRLNSINNHDRANPKYEHRRVTEIFKGPLDSCLERHIGLGLGAGLGFVGQRGVSQGEDSRIKFCEQHFGSAS